MVFVVSHCSIAVARRSDTATLNFTAFTPGVSADDTGRLAFGATVLDLEFFDNSGRMVRPPGD